MLIDLTPVYGQTSSGGAAQPYVTGGAG